MKKYIACFIIVLSSFTVLKANAVCPQRLSPQEFNKKQQEYITEQAGLTTVESSAFFKLFFELQSKKRENGKEINRLMKSAKNGLTEKEYDETLTKIYLLRKENAELELEYYKKYKDIISNQKIYDVMKAEAKFHREIIRGMHQRGRGGKNRNSN
ncbi:hypothetical protein Bcop_2419 [Bacteroides coprosuis DSM 18011]|uniref:DUF4168 domain-containing protein n=1 Tax=Bacteroides coprosuis DSM 18011 TaxID=679937 RepID=F3ZNZ8_9BACE|nr:MULTISPECIES: hypothetical protein [Bacteroides]EGJ72571.1 hypothetical protein Bcop_2419 [Bacteroides coprosuis DSM 18011]HJD91181.1 hypothetical protein [Bacteroides coprosuis]